MSAAYGFGRGDLVRLAETLPRRDIVNEHGVYLERFAVHGWMPGEERAFPFSVYLHRFRQSDADDALHNHPWSGVSLILAGGYREERLVDGKIEARTFLPGAKNVLQPDTFHRVDLLAEDCWTFFVVGEKVQSWGFVDRLTRQFTPWRDRLSQRGIEASY